MGRKRKKTKQYVVQLANEQSAVNVGANANSIIEKSLLPTSTTSGSTLMMTSTIVNISTSEETVNTNQGLKRSLEDAGK
jgi:hypothetical protein